MAEKARTGGFFMVNDAHIQEFQQALNADFKLQRAERRWLSFEYPRNKIAKDQGAVYWQFGQEAILIRQIIEKYKLNDEFITVSEQDQNQELSGFTVDLSPRKPVFVATDTEITRYVHRTHPIPKNATAEEIEDIKIDRRSLSSRLKSAKRKGIAHIVTALHMIGGKTGNRRVVKTQLKNQRKTNETNQKWLENTEIHGENGAINNLADGGSTAEKRYAELTAVSKGIQEYCDERGQVWAFIVVKLPPEYHPNPTCGKNSWNGVMPDASIKILNKQLREVQDVLNKLNIHITGQKTIETHKDGCPHMNLFIYFDEKYLKIIERAFKKAFGRSRNLCNFTLGKKGEQSGTYLTYITKHIQKHLGINNIINKTTLAEQACKSAWNWRSFESFGIPFVGPWRLLRSTAVQPHDYGTACLWKAARDGNFKEYISLMGGIDIKEKDRNFSLIKHKSKSGKSDVGVGILNKASRNETIIKKVGFWKIVQKKRQKNELNLEAAVVSDAHNFSCFTLKDLLACNLTNFTFTEMVKGLKFIKSKFHQKMIDCTVIAKSIYTPNWLENRNPTTWQAYPKTHMDNGPQHNFIKISSTLILNYASFNGNQIREPEKPKIDNFVIKKSPDIPTEQEKKQKVVKEKLANTLSHYQAIIADSIKLRSAYPTWMSLLRINNSELAAANLAR